MSLVYRQCVETLQREPKLKCNNIKQYHKLGTQLRCIVGKFDSSIETHINIITTCKISIWFRASPDHKQFKIRNCLQSASKDSEVVFKVVFIRLVTKVIVVRKSRGQKCPCRFDSDLSYK